MPSPDVVLVAPYPTAGQRHAGPSGVASYSANLAHALSGRGASVEVIAPEEPDAPDEPEISRDGSIVVRRSFRRGPWAMRSEEHTSELQSLMRISYAVFCLKK